MSTLLTKPVNELTAQDFTEKWTTEVYQDNSGCRCAIGHLRNATGLKLDYKVPFTTKALDLSERAFNLIFDAFCINLVRTNDGDYGDFSPWPIPGTMPDNPRDRVLAVFAYAVEKGL